MMRRWKKTYHQQEERDKNIVGYLLALLKNLGSPQSALQSPCIWCPRSLKAQEPFPFSLNRFLTIKWLPTVAHTGSVCKGLKPDISFREDAKQCCRYCVEPRIPGTWRSRSPVMEGAKTGKEGVVYSPIYSGIHGSGRESLKERDLPSLKSLHKLHLLWGGRNPDSEH